MSSTTSSKDEGVTLKLDAGECKKLLRAMLQAIECVNKIDTLDAEIKGTPNILGYGKLPGITSLADY